MKKEIPIRRNLKSEENQNLEGPSIEIKEKYKLFSKSTENIRNIQNITCVLKSVNEQKMNSDGLDEDQEIKLKFAAIVMDRLFFYMALIYGFITFIGLLVSMW